MKGRVVLGKKLYFFLLLLPWLPFGLFIGQIIQIWLFMEQCASTNNLAIFWPFLNIE
jgi:hypothetical protein